MGGKYVYDYPRPALTVDIVVFSWIDRSLRALFIKRGAEPYAGRWALPGGFVNEGEAFDAAALRELREETGLALDSAPTFVGNYGTKGRDPRGWTVSVAYTIPVRPPRRRVRGADDAKEADWLDIAAARDRLAFDHDVILADALRILRSGIEQGAAAASLFPTEFERSDVRTLLGSTGSKLSPATCLGRLKRLGLVERKPGAAGGYLLTTRRRRSR